MKDLSGILHNTHRPKLLIGAAQMAANSLFQKEITLPRLRKSPAALLEEEAQLNSARMGGSMGYSATRHIEVLAVLICQANRSGAPQPRQIMG